jgi:hypothetical protein
MNTVDVTFRMDLIWSAAEYMLYVNTKKLVWRAPMCDYDSAVSSVRAIHDQHPNVHGIVTKSLYRTNDISVALVLYCEETEALFDGTALWHAWQWTLCDGMDLMGTTPSYDAVTAMTQVIMESASMRFRSYSTHPELHALALHAIVPMQRTYWYGYLWTSPTDKFIFSEGTGVMTVTESLHGHVIMSYEYPISKTDDTWLDEFKMHQNKCRSRGVVIHVEISKHTYMNDTIKRLGLSYEEACQLLLNQHDI